MENLGSAFSVLFLDFSDGFSGVYLVITVVVKLIYGLLLLLLLSRFSHVRLCVTPPGSPVPGILQARTLAWVAISFSNA